MSDPAAPYADSVFINCPFDDEYKPVFDALIFTLFACRFQPRSALELEDGSQTRIDKLYAIVEGCRYGVHDISRTELDTTHLLPRFNMPLELGIFLGAKKYGDEQQRLKRCLILDVERYRYQKFVSDLAGMDIKGHQGDVERAIKCLRDWLANASRRDLPSAELVQSAYARFLAKKSTIARRLGFSSNDIPYVDYERMVAAWLLEAGSLGHGRKRSKRNS